MNVTFVVKVLNKEKQIVDAYCRREKMSFTPALGMKLSVNSRTAIWKTTDGAELNPEIKEIVYNLDDDELYCLFEVEQVLASSYWSRIKNMSTNHELKQFRLHNDLGNPGEDAAAETAEKREHQQSIGNTVLMLVNIIVPFGLLCYNAIQNIESIF